MSGVLVALPLQLVCQLFSQGNLGNYGNVTVVGDTSPVNKTTTVLPTGYTAFPDIGVAYKFFPNKLTWDAARKQCIAEGASLVIVDSFQKIRYLMTVKDKAQGIHTGIHRFFDGVEWMNINTGRPLDFIPWKPDANLAATTGMCTAMWHDGSGIGPWICKNVLPSVCEIPMFGEHKSEAQIFQGPIAAIIPN